MATPRGARGDPAAAAPPRARAHDDAEGAADGADGAGNGRDEDRSIDVDDGDGDGDDARARAAESKGTAAYEAVETGGNPEGNGDQGGVPQGTKFARVGVAGRSKASEAHERLRPSIMLVDSETRLGVGPAKPQAGEASRARADLPPTAAATATSILAAKSRRPGKRPRTAVAQSGLAQHKHQGNDDHEEPARNRQQTGAGPKRKEKVKDIVAKLAKQQKLRKQRSQHAAGGADSMPVSRRSNARAGQNTASDRPAQLSSSSSSSSATAGPTSWPAWEEDVLQQAAFLLPLIEDARRRRKS